MQNTCSHLLYAGLIMWGMSTASAAGAPDTLPPCPATPNCVSSQATDAKHFVAPVAYTGAPGQAMQRMQAVLDALARSTPVVQSGSYLHYEVRSLIFRFVDDVECLLDAEHGVIHIRSASRVGRGDFGVNRRRVERIRTAFGTPGDGE